MTASELSRRNTPAIRNCSSRSRRAGTGGLAAELMGLTQVEAEAYARDVIHADFEEAGEEDVVRKILGDLTSAGVDMDEATIRDVMHEKQVEARRQFIEAKN